MGKHNSYVAELEKRGASTVKVRKNDSNVNELDKYLNLKPEEEEDRKVIFFYFYYFFYLKIFI